MKKLEWVGNGIGLFFTLTQTNQVFQIISLIFTLISTLVATAYTLWCWWKKAKQDGKIDEKEIEEAFGIVKDSVDKVNDIVNKENNNGSND